MPALEQRFPLRKRIARYFEPFVGGAAVFFRLLHPAIIELAITNN